MQRSMVMCLVLILCLTFTTAQANIFDDIGDAWDSATDWVEDTASDVGDWVSDAADDTADWVSNAAEDTADWVSNAASDTADWVSNSADSAWDWTSGAASDAWGWTVEKATGVKDWTVSTANGTWDEIDGFFNPPSTKGNPNIPAEPELPEGVLKMYVGYPAIKTGLDNGYSNELEIGKGDPHYGISMGKFYISGFSAVKPNDKDQFVFLKNVGDNVELHFELVQDINMINGDKFDTIKEDVEGYDKQMGVKPTNFGRGTLIVKHTDYQNHTGEPQVYTNYLAAKVDGSANTVISLNEEGDYEVALDYEIEDKYYAMGVGITDTTDRDYRIHFTFLVRNGNCMAFPFDLATGEELGHTSITPNGFRLDLAYSRYLEINVKYSVLKEGAGGIVEDVRFNRPAKDGDEYKQEGIYTISAHNQYTDLDTVKTIYVGSDQKLIDYINQGLTVDQIISEMND